MSLCSEDGFSGMMRADAKDVSSREAICASSGRCVIVIDEGGCRVNIRGKCGREIGERGALVSSACGCFTKRGASPCASSSRWRVVLLMPTVM